MSTVELSGARWQKSTRSSAGGNANCVEIASLGPHTAVRDSKNPHGPALIVPTPTWTRFLTAI